jgi:hypothetical protein
MPAIDDPKIAGTVVEFSARGFGVIRLTTRSGRGYRFIAKI